MVSYNIPPSQDIPDLPVSHSHLSHTFRSVPPPDEAGGVVDEVVVDPVLTTQGAAFLGRHVTRDDEVPEGSVIVLQVLNYELFFFDKVNSSKLCLPMIPEYEH